MQLRLLLHTAMYVVSVSAVLAAALNPAGTATALRKQTRRVVAAARNVSASATAAPIVAASEINPRPASAQTKARDAGAAAHRVPIGAVLAARLRSPIDSRTAQANDQVDAILTSPVVQDNVELIPAGSALHGTILLAEPATKEAPRGRVEIIFTVVQHAETRSRAAIRTRKLTFEAEAPPEPGRGRRAAKRQPIDVALPAGEPLMLTLAEALVVYIPVAR